MAQPVFYADVRKNQKAIFEAFDAIGKTGLSALAQVAKVATDRTEEKGFAEGAVGENKSYPALVPQAGVKPMASQRKSRRGPREMYDKRGFNRKNKYSMRPSRPAPQIQWKFAKSRVVERKLDLSFSFEEDISKILRALTEEKAFIENANYSKRIRHRDLEIEITKSQNKGISMRYSVVDKTGATLYSLARIRIPGRQRLDPVGAQIKFAARNMTKYFKYHAEKRTKNL